MDEVNKDPESESLLSKWRKKAVKPILANAIVKAPEGSDIPLSYGQQRLWFLQQLYPKNPFYNYSETYVFRGILNETLLERSIQKLIEDHDILRSTYHIENGKTVQRFDAQPNIDIVKYDFSQLAIARAHGEAKKIMYTDATIGFDLSKGPLVKISLIKLGDKEYLLQVTMHHILTDKWSMGVLREQLAKHYTDLCTHGFLKTDIPVKIQYADFAYWQQHQEIAEGQFAYWKHKLSGEIPQLDIPTDYPRPIHPSFSGAYKVQEYSGKLSSDLLNLAKTLETTPYVLLLTVYYVLLFRFSGQKDILIGSPISNRDEKVLEDLIGFFNETIVLRTSFTGKTSFSELVKEVRKTTLEAFSNKNVPFDHLVKSLKPDRSLSVNPFFQVMFLYHAMPKAADFGPDLSLSSSPFDSGVSKFDLTLYIAEENGLLSSTFEYATDLFQDTTIQRFQECFKLLLEAVVANPEQTLSGLPIHTEAERQLLIGNDAEGPGAYANYNGIHEIIEKVAIDRSDDLALVYQDKTLTYGALNHYAEVIAKKLLENADHNKHIIGLCMERSLDMIVAMLAILKAGHAYLPLDPDYPAQRIQYILKDAQVSMVLTQESLCPILKDFEGTILTVDTVDFSERSAVELPKVQLEDLAYVIYTSGSTGQPKGVPISHKNIINSTQGRLEFYNHTPSAFLLMSSISFDSSKAGIFWTLCTGGTLVISEKRIEQDVEHIAETIQKNNISHTLMLPSLYQLVLEHATVGHLSSLNTVIVAGEACFAAMCANHFKLLPGVKLFNEYGPTEATVWCLAHEIREKDLERAIPIGRAVANAKVYLLNTEMEMVPFGAKGEIYIGGPGLARNYLNQQELTEAMFVDHSFSDSIGEKLYKTGDLGKFLEDGSMIFLGRTDQQVKIRGFRIELDEIEKIVQENPMVEKAVVLVERLGEVDGFESTEIPKAATLAALLEKHLTDERVEQLLQSVASLKDGERKFLLARID